MLHRWGGRSNERPRLNNAPAPQSGTASARGFCLGDQVTGREAQIGSMRQPTLGTELGVYIHRNKTTHIFVMHRLDGHGIVQYKTVFFVDTGWMNTELSVTKRRFFLNIDTTETKLSVTKWRCFCRHRLDGHGIVRNKMACFFLNIDLMETELSVTKWRFFCRHRLVGEWGSGGVGDA